jgi:chromosomal replication initiation ATPase DnaA
MTANDSFKSRMDAMTSKYEAQQALLARSGNTHPNTERALRDIIRSADLYLRDNKNEISIPQDSEMIEQILQEAADKIYDLTGKINTVSVRYHIEDENLSKRNLECLNYLADQVVLETAVSFIHIQSKSKRRENVKPRFLLMGLAANLIPGISLQSIGDAIGGRDHSSVIHARDTLVNDMLFDQAYKAQYDKIAENFKKWYGSKYNPPAEVTSTQVINQDNG